MSAPRISSDVTTQQPSAIWSFFARVVFPVPGNPTIRIMTGRLGDMAIPNRIKEGNSSRSDAGGGHSSKPGIVTLYIFLLTRYLCKGGCGDYGFLTVGLRLPERHALMLQRRSRKNSLSSALASACANPP